MNSNIQVPTLDQVITEYTNTLNQSGLVDGDVDANDKLVIINNIDNAITFRKERFDLLVKELKLFLLGQGWSSIPSTTRIDKLTKKENEYAQLIQTVKSAMINVDNIQVLCTPATDTTTGATVASKYNDILMSFLNDPINKKAINRSKFESRGMPISITCCLTNDNGALQPDILNDSGEVFLKNIPIEKFWWQPSSTEIENCDYVFTGDIYSWSQILAYTHDKDFDKELINKLYDACKNILNSKYNAGSTDKFEPFKTGDESKEKDLAYKVPMFIYYEKTRENDKWVIYQKFVLFKKVVIGSKKLNITNLPFAILKEYSVPNNFYGRSTVEMSLSVIKPLMLLDSVFQTITQDAYTQIGLINKASGINAKQIMQIKRLGGGFIDYGSLNSNIQNLGDNAITYVKGRQITNEMLSFRQLLINELQTIAGINQITLGESYGSATNGSAVNGMIAQSTSRDADAIQEFTFYLHRVCVLLLDALKNQLMNGKRKRNFYVQNTDATDITKGNLFKPIELTNEDTNSGIGRIIINGEVLRVNKQEENLRNLLQIYQISSQNPPKETDIVRPEDIVSQLSLPNKSTILQRAVGNSEIVKIGETASIIAKAFEIAKQPQAQMLSVFDVATLINQEIKVEKEKVMNGETPEQVPVNEAVPVQATEDLNQPEENYADDEAFNSYEDDPSAQLEGENYGG